MYLNITFKELEGRVIPWEPYYYFSRCDYIIINGELEFCMYIIRDQRVKVRKLPDFDSDKNI